MREGGRGGHLSICHSEVGAPWDVSPLTAVLMHLSELCTDLAWLPGAPYVL